MAELLDGLLRLAPDGFDGVEGVVGRENDIWVAGESGEWRVAVNC